MGKPYAFLDNTIRVVIHHPKLPTENGLIKALRDIPLYDVTLKSEYSNIESVFSIKKIHLCVIDSSENKIRLLRDYRNVSFVAVYDMESAGLGFKLAEEGVKCIVSQKECEDTSTLVKINHYALLNIINPYYRQDGKLLNVATDALFKKDTGNVTEWAMSVERTARQLCNVFQVLRANPKIIHSIFHLYRRAFFYHMDEKLPKDYKRDEEYFFVHRSRILNHIHRTDWLKSLYHSAAVS